MSEGNCVSSADLPAIAALCRRGVWMAPTEDELRVSLFPPDQDVAVLGDPETGIVAVVREGSQAWIRLLVVHPGRRRCGVGVALLAAAEGELAGPGTLAAGGDPQYPLFPGVVATDLALVATFEAAGFHPESVVSSMEFDLRAPLPTDPGGWELADPAADAQAVGAFAGPAGAAAGHALTRALAAESLVVVEQGNAVVGACAVDLDRAGVIGPVVTAGSPTERARLEHVLLSGAVRVMRKRGHARGDLAVAASVRPAARLGAKLARVSVRYSKSLTV